MLVQFQDFNGSDVLLRGNLAPRWTEIETVLQNLQLHVKNSDQAGKQGSLIWDPVGANEAILIGLQAAGWPAHIPIPQAFNFLGKDIDFGRDGIVVEVQFSNYPFLLNNTLRSELFYQAQSHITGAQTQMSIIITKAGMFPSSNSTLYYEQAQQQLDSLAQHHVFDVPIRLVGLFEDPGTVVSCVHTQYDAPRYSRTVQNRTQRQCRIGPLRDGPCKLALI